MKCAHLCAHARNLTITTNAMVTIKIFLDKRRITKKETYPLNFRIYYGGKSATRSMLHAGGYYKYGSKTNLAASEACFGIVNVGNSPNNPSNATVNNAVSTVVGQANKSQTNPDLIQVIVE